jgi:hypothetical protein
MYIVVAGLDCIVPFCSQLVKYYAGRLMGCSVGGCARFVCSYEREREQLLPVRRVQCGVSGVKIDRNTAE